MVQKSLKTVCTPLQAKNTLKMPLKALLAAIWPRVAAKGLFEGMSRCFSPIGGYIGFSATFGPSLRIRREGFRGGLLWSWTPQGHPEAAKRALKGILGVKIGTNPIFVSGWSKICQCNRSEFFFQRFSTQFPDRVFFFVEKCSRFCSSLPLVQNQPKCPKNRPNHDDLFICDI